MSTDTLSLISFHFIILGSLSILGYILVKDFLEWRKWNTPVRDKILATFMTIAFSVAIYAATRTILENY